MSRVELCPAHVLHDSILPGPCLVQRATKIAAVSREAAAEQAQSYGAALRSFDEAARLFSALQVVQAQSPSVSSFASSVKTALTAQATRTQ